MKTLIKLLTEAMNNRYGSTLTNEQVENWVGCDAKECEIVSYRDEVICNSPHAVTPKDVLELWDEEV